MTGDNCDEFILLMRNSTTGEESWLKLENAYLEQTVMSKNEDLFGASMFTTEIYPTRPSYQIEMTFSAGTFTLAKDSKTRHYYERGPNAL